MELDPELFVAAFAVIIFTFAVAKLVSIAVVGDERQIGFKESGDNVRGERVVEAAKFDGGLRVQRTRSNRKVRFADESVGKVEAFEGERIREVEDKRCGSGVVCDSAAGRSEVLGASVESREGRLTEAAAAASEEIVGGAGVGGMKEEDAVTNSDGLDVEGGSERKQADHIGSVVKEGNAPTVDEFERQRSVDKLEETRFGEELEEKRRDSALIGDSAGLIEVLEVVGGSVESSEGQLTEEDVVAGITGGAKVGCIREEDAVTNLVRLVVDGGNERKDADDIEGNSLINLAFEEKLVHIAEADSMVDEIKEEDAVTNSDGLVVKEGSEEKDANYMETVVKERNAMTNLVFEEKIVENAEADSKTDAGSAKDDVVVAEDAEVRDVKRRDGKEELVRDEEGEEEDDWEGIERSELDEVFAAASDYVATGGKDDDRLSNVGSDVQMQLYGLHKVAMEGPCHEPQPMALKISSRAKWNAWQRMGNMNPEVAMEQYIALLSDKVPGWMEGKSSGDDNANSLESGRPPTPYPTISTDPYDQHNSTKKRELESSGTAGGD